MYNNLPEKLKEMECNKLKRCMKKILIMEFYSMDEFFEDKTVMA